MWTAGKIRGKIPENLRQAWEDAVVRIDDDEYWLAEMLATSSIMAARWLQARIANNDWRPLSNEKIVDSACQTLDRAQRLRILGIYRLVSMTRA